MQRFQHFHKHSTHYEEGGKSPSVHLHLGSTTSFWALDSDSRHQILETIKEMV
jgi:hypothetical protein